MIVPNSEQDPPSDEERLLAIGRQFKGDNAHSRRGKFSEVKGLCRTCTNAFIRRREMSEVPHVICGSNYEMPHRVPLDIMECSKYQRVGEAHLRDMYEQALVIDIRQKGGQYL